jgi:hypothetical protein
MNIGPYPLFVPNPNVFSGHLIQVTRHRRHPRTTQPAWGLDNYVIRGRTTTPLKGTNTQPK